MPSACHFWVKEWSSVSLMNDNSFIQNWDWSYFLSIWLKSLLVRIMSFFSITHYLVHLHFNIVREWKMKIFSFQKSRYSENSFSLFFKILKNNKKYSTLDKIAVDPSRAWERVSQNKQKFLSSSRMSISHMASNKVDIWKKCLTFTYLQTSCHY